MLFGHAPPIIFYYLTLSIDSIHTSRPVYGGLDEAPSPETTCAGPLLPVIFWPLKNFGNSLKKDRQSKCLLLIRQNKKSYQRAVILHVSQLKQQNMAAAIIDATRHHRRRRRGLS